MVMFAQSYFDPFNAVIRKSYVRRGRDGVAGNSWRPIRDIVFASMTFCLRDCWNSGEFTASPSAHFGPCDEDWRSPRCSREHQHAS